jgi:hypothetical protein
MHSIHTTVGFIIDSRPYSEAGKSKLRYFSQIYSFGNFSFVKGKEYWRLTNAEDAENFSSEKLMVRLAMLLGRLLHGEETNAELFDCIFETAKFLSANSLSKEKLEILESVTVGRILHKLGYIGNDLELNQYFNSNDISLDLLDLLKDKKLTINKHINKALKESHL